MKKSDSLQFATCFICKGTGHLAKDCLDNPNGLYPNGGCCHLCQLKNHFSRDCPSRKRTRVTNQSIKPQQRSNVSTENLNDDAIDHEPLYEHELEEDTPVQKKLKGKSKYFLGKKK